MESKNSNTNFWISYADLMAGLLFVFILLIGAIIVKYSLLQTESDKLEENLEKEHLALIQRDERIKKIVDDLEETKKDLKNRLLENEKLQIDLNNKESEVKSFLLSNNQLKEKVKSLDEKKKELLDSINALDNQLKNKDERIFSFENRLNKISLEKEQLQDSLQKLDTLSKEKEEKLNKLLEDVLLKETLISSFEKKTKLLNDEMIVMQEQLKHSKNEHEVMAQNLAATKQKIKSFTGIKIKVISQLKDKLGKSIQIDPKNGSLRLSSKVLFDEGEFELKQSSQEVLKVAVYDYFKTILDNDEINRHIDKIVIEGHTNSKGNYLYNLELSQKRAYSVMDFLLTLDFKRKEKLKKLIAASGRSFLDPVFTNEGKEDQDASRRIEIKLSLKNEEAIKEISNLLE